MRDLLKKNSVKSNRKRLTLQGSLGILRIRQTRSHRQGYPCSSRRRGPIRPKRPASSKRQVSRPGSSPLTSNLLGSKLGNKLDYQGKLGLEARRHPTKMRPT